LPSPKYRWCHGTQTLSRTEFSLLFSRLGESWGVGDGSTTFNLPNLDKQFLAGFDSAGDTGDAVVGEAGGSATGSVAAHTHGPGSYAVVLPANGVNGAGTGATLGGTYAVTGTSDSGGGGTIDTVPPYKVVRYLIKVM
jgi:hypothetical protein